MSKKRAKKLERVIEEWMVPVPTFDNAEVYADIVLADNQVIRVSKVHVVFTDPEDEVQEQWRYLNTVPTVLEKQIVETLNGEYLHEILEFIKEEEEEAEEEAALSGCTL